MKRTNILELKLNKKKGRILKELLVRSACLFNLGNYMKRQVFFENQKTGNLNKIPTGLDLQKELKTHKDYKKLGSANSQQILNKLEENWRSYFNSIKSKRVNHKVSLPKYYKNRTTNTTMPYILRCRNDCYTIDREHIYISCPKDLKEKYNIKNMLKIKTKGILRWIGKQGHCEILYDSNKKRFYAKQVISQVLKKGYVDEKTRTVKYEKIKTVEISTKIASIDLGIKRFVSTLIQNRCVAYDTQKAFDNYQNICKDICKYQSILTNEWQDKKGKPTKYTSKRINKLFDKKRLRLEHLQNCVIKQLFNLYLKNNINTIIIGDIKNIRNAKKTNKSNSKKQQSTLNRMINNFWSFGKLIHKIECKAEEHNIKIIRVSEAYTSSTCPINKKHKVEVKNRDFFCLDCGYKHDRDAVGCINILKNYTQKSVETKPKLSIVEIQ